MSIQRSKNLRTQSTKTLYVDTDNTEWSGLSDWTDKNGALECWTSELHAWHISQFK